MNLPCTGFASHSHEPKLGSLGRGRRAHALWPVRLTSRRVVPIGSAVQSTFSSAGAADANVQTFMRPLLPRLPRHIGWSMGHFLFSLPRPMPRLQRCTGSSWQASLGPSPTSPRDPPRRGGVRSPLNVSPQSSRVPNRGSTRRPITLPALTSKYSPSNSPIGTLTNESGAASLWRALVYHC